MFRLFIILLAILIYMPRVAAQTIDRNPNQPGTNSVTVVEGLYQQPAGPYAALYNGAEHPDYDPRMIGSAYYGGNDWQYGNVFYQGVLFTQVPLKFDLVRNRLIILHHNQFNKLELANAFLDSFSVNGNSFIQFRDKTAPSMPAAFYHKMVSGPVTVLARREKMIREFIEGMEVKREINEKNSYYLLKEGTYYTINNQRDLLNLMGDDRKEVQQHWRAAGVKFRRNKEEAIKLAAQHYNQLNPR